MKAWRLSFVAVSAVLAVLAISFAGAYPHRHEDRCCEHASEHSGETLEGCASLQHVVSYACHETCQVCFFKKLTSSSRIEPFKGCPVPPDTDTAVVTGMTLFTSTNTSFIDSRGPPAS